MATLITYDISTEHTTVKRRCLNIGFRDCTWNGHEWLRLPNTTLVHQSSSIAFVFRQFRAAVSWAEQRTGRRIVIEKLYGLPKARGLIDSDETCDGPTSQP